MAKKKVKAEPSYTVSPEVARITKEALSVLEANLTPPKVTRRRTIDPAVAAAREEAKRYIQAAKDVAAAHRAEAKAAKLDAAWERLGKLETSALAAVDAANKRLAEIRAQIAKLDN